MTVHEANDEKEAFCVGRWVWGDGGAYLNKTTYHCVVFISFDHLSVTVIFIASNLFIHYFMYF